MLSVVDRTVISFLIVDIKRDLHLSDVKLSLLQGFAHALFYALFGLPIGRLADRSTRRNVVAGGLALWSAATVACGLARGFAPLFLARVGVGVGEASLHPSAYSMIADYFPRRRMALAMGVYTVGSVLGVVGAAAASGAILKSADVDGDIVLPLIGAVRAWQATFFAVGAPGLVLAALMFTIREPARRGATAESAMAPPVGDIAAFMARHSVTYASLFVGYSITTLLAYAFLGWAPALMVRHFHFSPAEVSLWFGSLTLLGGLVGVAAGGAGPSLIGKRGGGASVLMLTIVAAMASGLAGVAVGIAGGRTGFLAALALFMAFIFVPVVLGPVALQNATPNRMRGQISALFLLINTLVGMGCGPLVVGLLTDHVFRDESRLNASMAATAAAAAVLATLALILGLRTFPRTAQEAAGGVARDHPPAD
jgi:MFS family permease